MFTLCILDSIVKAFIRANLRPAKPTNHHVHTNCINLFFPWKLCLKIIYVIISKDSTLVLSAVVKRAHGTTPGYGGIIELHNVLFTCSIDLQYIPVHLNLAKWDRDQWGLLNSNSTVHLPYLSALIKSVIASSLSQTLILLPIDNQK